MHVTYDTRLRQASGSITLTTQAYESLKAGILDGTLEPGRIYPLSFLSEQIGVSRTPVREALQRLSAEEWITFTGRGAAKIVHPTAEDAREYFEIREALEGYAIARIDPRTHAETLALLREALAKQRELMHSDHADLSLQAARQFHRHMVVATENAKLIGYYDQMTQHLELFGREAIHAGHSAQEMVAEHEQMLDLLELGDARAAHDVLIRHIRESSRPYSSAPE